MTSSSEPRKPLRRKLLLALGGIAGVTCVVAGWICFSFSADYIGERIVADEARFMAARGRAADRDFDIIAEAHSAADIEWRTFAGNLSDDEAEALFAEAFEKRADGTYRLKDRFYDGTVFQNQGYAHFAGFVPPGPVDVERKRALVAGLRAIRTVAGPGKGNIASLALALPSGEMIIFAPDRPDDLLYYRHEAPADFSVWKHIIVERGAKTQCTGPIQVGWDPSGKSLAAGCQTMAERDGRAVGAWDSTLPLNRRLTALLETDDRTQSSIVATEAGSVIVAPELGFSATASAEEMNRLSEAYGVAELIAQIRERGQDSGAFQAADGRWIVRYHRFSGPEWVLIDLISRRDVMMETMRAPVLITLLLLLALTAQAVLVGAFVQRRFVSPLKILTEVFGKPRAEQNLDDPRLIEVQAKDDEIGLLAARLAGARRDHDDIIETLEERVAERTAEYEQASRAKSEFLANMSHEIRTPMNGVLGMAELLTTTALDDKQRVYADTIHSSASALLTILNDILDFSKIEAGRLELDAHPFDFHQAIDDVALLLGASAREKGLELVIRYDPSMPKKVMGDAGRLRQVLTNLVGNALKFTHEGYVLVNVTGAGAGDEAIFRVEVSDTGIGVPLDKQAVIFDQFTQSDGATTRRYGGTGLGLAISRRLVELMGGTIGVRSQPGEGSTFWFEIALPVAKAEDASAAAAGLPPAHILVVDDLAVNRQILDEQLSAWGLDAECVPSGAAALARLEEIAAAGAPLPLVLLDYHMPEMDGLVFAERLRASEAAKASLLVLSSASTDNVHRAFRALGAKDVLTKPVPGETLRRALTKALGDGVLSAAPKAPPPVQAAAAPAEAVGADDKADPDSDPGPGHDSDPGHDPGPGALRILIADDNLTNRLVCQHMLTGIPCRIHFAQDGREAVELVAATDFDLVLMDISMPVMDGIEATRVIREKEAGAAKAKRTPIIALTAHAMPADKDRFLSAGMDDYLAKPISKERLEEVVAKWTRGEDDEAGVMEVG